MPATAGATKPSFAATLRVYEALSSSDGVEWTVQSLVCCAESECHRKMAYRKHATLFFFIFFQGVITLVYFIFQEVDTF